MMRRMLLFWLFVLATLQVYAVPQWQATITANGCVRLLYAGKELGTLSPGLFESSWRNATVQPAPIGVKIPDALCHGKIISPSGIPVDVAMQYALENGGLHLQYRLTPQQDIHLNTLFVGMNMPVGRLSDGQYRVDGITTTFPSTFGAVVLSSKPTTSFALVIPNAGSLQVQFTTPTQTLVQDDRQWGQTFSFRFGPGMNPATAWPAGKTVALDMTLSAPGSFTLSVDEPVTITAGDDWIPLDTKLDIVAGSALDFSSLIPWHTPAGKYGRVIATADGKMALAQQPKQAVRFYGCNLCFTGQYLSHDEADRLATRLQRLGYNAVRLHHYESNLIDRTQGDSLHFKPDALDKLDYLVAALKQRGIYITTDLFVSRPVFAREVWDGATGDVAMDEFKMAVPVNERAFANYSAFFTSLLTHVNPYTSMRWGDDPALAWLSLINEGNEGNFIGRLTARLKPDWQQAWNAWLAAKYPSRDALERVFGALPAGQNPTDGTVPLPTQINDTPTGKQLSCFLADTDAQFFARTRTALRTIGCSALLTNLNAWTNPVQTQVERQEFDYVDDHFYVDHPQFLEQPWRLPSKCNNSSPVADGAPGGRSCAFTRLMDRPFTISEFNYAGPGRYRGVGGMLTSAMGALQDWSVIWRFAYSHSRENVITPGAINYFDLAADPLNQAADRAGVCLFRRGDMRPAPHSVAIIMNEEDTAQHPTTAHGVAPAWNCLALVTRVGTQVVANFATSPIHADLALPLSGATPNNGKWLSIDPYGADAQEKIFAELRARGWLNQQNISNPRGPVLQSETGELTVNGPADVFTLDTPRTAGGFAPAGAQINTSAVKITIETTDATVWVSSLDSNPIPTSHRLLITHLTDLQNSGALYADQSRRVLSNWGKLPHLVRAGSATLTIALQHPEKARVWGLATDGTRLAQVATRTDHGALVIPLDINANGNARIMYEIEVQP